jgi:transcriptional regulator with XRE-family HTH domain
VTTTSEEPGDDDVSAFGEYLRTQRQLAKLSLRQLAALARVSNPYLSQIERGLHKPSIAVVKSLASALNVSADVLLAQAAGIDADDEPTDTGRTEAAIREDPRLTASQKETLLSVYRSLVDTESRTPPDPAAPAAPPEAAAPPTPSPPAEKATPTTKRAPRSPSASRKRPAS